MLRGLKQCLVLVCTACLAVSAWAAKASDASIEELLSLSKTDSMLETISAPMERAIRQSMQFATKGKPLSAEQEKAASTYLAKTSSILREEMNWATLKPMMMDVYRETYDQEEVDGLIVFYKSPIGQALVNKMPVMAQRSMDVSQRHMQRVLPKILAAMAEATEELKKVK